MVLTFLLLPSYYCSSDGNVKTKKHSKWDQAAPGAGHHAVSSPSSAPESSTEPSVSAAVAAARLNAMLEAKGKLLKVQVCVLIRAHQLIGITLVYNVAT